jgi:hypothetical protein
MADLFNPQPAQNWVLGGAAPNAPTQVSQSQQSTLTPWQVQALQEYAENMTKSANNPAKNQWGVPGGISSPWQGVANITKELMAGLATRKANEANAAGFKGWVKDSNGAWAPASNAAPTTPVTSQANPIPNPAVPTPPPNPWRNSGQGVSFLDPWPDGNSGSAA